MLNELHQVVTALQGRGVAIEEQHPSLTPMGKNDPLLIVELDTTGSPADLVIEQPEIAGKLLRVCHGSQGSSFPGFNIPTPLRVFARTKPDKLKDRFKELRRQRRDAAWVSRFVHKLVSRSKSATFTSAQSKQFERSTRELVGWLRADFATGGQELANFVRLLQSVSDARPELASFAAETAKLLATSGTGASTEQRWLMAEWLFTNRKLPVYLQCQVDDRNQPRVADSRMGRLLNQQLLDIGAQPFDSNSRSGACPATARDAYTGQPCEITDTFPDPKVTLLGNVRLFANNTSEAACFFRYGLGGSETFKVSKETAQQMAGALLQLASDDRLNKTCRPIPSNRGGKQDLLVAYLEDEPDAPDPYVELFGNEAPTFDAPDFAAAARPVLAALEGKVAANPNQLVRLLAIAALDKANKQVSLNRSFTVGEVMAAAKAWQAGAANCPPVTLPFFDREAKKPLPKSRTAPSPLDAASVLNKVWASNSEGGFNWDFHRIFSVSDAYDVFLSPASLRESKTRFALQTLLARMSNVFASAAVVKATWDFKTLNEPARWCVLKAVALAGIFLNQLGQRHELFMKEPTYQLGRLLAYADSLHQQYCKHVRGDETPTQLIGNALFATALEQPVFALARLAERLVPYQAWAKTFKNTNPEVKSGYEKTLLRLIGACAAHFIEDHEGTFVIRVDELPGRMSDTDKAKLLLGYLADHPKPETQKD
ncbi:MAG: hypothetical protein FJ398_21070 [Verrucomicrobia bacterium]|nr:hypothetical protein [Verrucomicrobiota bacterium]